jgi:small subunit ribosomal protein S6e
MAAFKFVISDPETRKSYQLEVDQSKALGLIGKKIGEEFSGDLIGLSGYSLKISGGSDRDGFPMHPTVRGIGRKKVLLASPPGFHPTIKGERRRKYVRGDTVSDSIVQINVRIMKKGGKPIEEIVPTKSKATEKPKEEKVEEKKQETGGGESKKEG